MLGRLLRRDVKGPVNSYSLKWSLSMHGVLLFVAVVLPLFPYFQPKELPIPLDFTVVLEENLIEQNVPQPAEPQTKKAPEPEPMVEPEPDAPPPLPLPDPPKDAVVIEKKKEPEKKKPPEKKAEKPPEKKVEKPAEKKAPVKPTFVVDVSATFKAKMKAIHCYKSQFEGAKQAGEIFPTGQHLDERVETQAEHYGSLIRTRYGEPFFTQETMEVEDVVGLSVQSM